MITDWQVVAVAAGVVAAAINAGAFFTFSNFVMPALGTLPRREGAAAMQAINTAAPNPTFVATIVGAGLVTVPVIVTELGHLDESAIALVTVGAAMSLASLAITVAANVPRNDALDRVDPASPAGQDYWAEYLVGWTRWNTLRTITSTASALLYALSLR